MSDREYLHVSWHWKIAGTDEIAITGVNLSQVAEPFTGARAALDEINMSTLGPLLLTMMNALMNGDGALWADYSNLNMVRIAAVGVDGLEIGDAKIFEDLTVRSGFSNDTPPQSSIVVSFRSGLSTGAANFGRMYLPHTALTLEALTPHASTAITNAFALDAQTFANSLTTQVNAQVTPALVIFIITHKPAFASKPALQVAVGNVNDTQRRRRNQLDEVYAFLPIP